MEQARTPARAPVAGTLLIVVAFAAAAVAAWVAWGGAPLPATARNLPATGEAGRLAADPLALADFDAGTEDYSHVRGFPDVRALDFLSPAEVRAYEAAGAGAARMTVASRRPEGRVLAVVVKVADRAAALRAADELDGLQSRFGLQRRDPEQGVHRITEVDPARGGDAGSRPTARAHYTHADLVVRVELNARTSADLARFGALVAKQLTALPADG
ncbi:hypothetical protein JOF41_006208 [Saccharothrix coeruleofusca]|uniref:hypothetical protein n=1 Tax=Saccharothrix coeruleofusca TaxID=33919 RepID=UPI001AE5B1DE|nr:hypothetical protein [Saccharothrix coeruleofusca]MBP2340030.1 hypothetical protein [Saccharothrix coeruleofusca]